MSENQLLRNSMHSNDEENTKLPIIAVYEAESIDQVKIEEKLKKIYAPIQYPLCGNYVHPELNTIKCMILSILERKRELDKKFAQEILKVQSSQNSLLDGLYEFTNKSEQNSDSMIRQKIRIVRDLRQEFFQQNGEYIIQKELFSDELSKLANISFQNNSCIQFFQKNAILSQRNNQKKQNPFQIQLFIGGIWFNKHPLNNEEEKKFEQVRPLLKEWAYASNYPVLPQIAKQLRYLEALSEKQEVDQDLILRKIDVVNKKYNDQKLYLETLMKNIIRSNEQLRDIRKKTGMESVPWKIFIKEIEVEGQTIPNYDIGVTPVQINDKVVAINPSDIELEHERRQQIKSQAYFIKIFANDYEVGTSQKFKLQWPAFKVPIMQKFNIMVFTAPATLKVEVIKSGFINQTVDTIYLPVPGINAKSITSTEKKYAASTFASNGRDFRKQQKGDGKADRIQPEPPCGMIIYKMQWKGEGSKMPQLATKTAEQETDCTQQTQVEDVSVMEELFDAKDPRMQHKKMNERVERDIQHRGSNAALLPFINVQSARHLLLKLKQILPELEHVQIPLREQQIRNREDLLQIIENQKYKRDRTLQDTHLDYFHPLQGMVFQQQPKNVKEQIHLVLDKIKILKGISGGSGGGNIRYKITEQIINEYIFEQMQSPLVIFFKNLFTQKRKLGPQSSTRIQAKTKIDELQINLHVRSAKNVNIRESSFERIKNFQDEQNKFRQQQLMMQNNNQGANDRFAGYGAGFFRQQQNVNMHGNNFFNAFQNQGRNNQEVTYDERIDLDRVNSFIQMRFKKIVKRTRCFEGPFPQWNQTLCFNYSMKHEQTSVQKILLGLEKSLKVFVFDMREQSKSTQAVSEARVKKSKFYMGRVDVPFSFMIAIPSISGLFQINRPLICLGYGTRRHGLFDYDGEQPEEMTKTQNPDIHTYVNLDLFTEPLIDNLVAYNSDRKFIPGSQQNPLVLQRSSDWLDELNTKRYVRLWLSNIDGKSIFICRYLSELICPPKQLGGEGGSMIQRCARFVSLIPRKYNCKIMEGLDEYHMSCHDFLNIKMGEDHGILLCNYFNFIDHSERKDYQSMLLICKAFPYGKCIFVLRRDKGTKNCQVWDPYKGECYYFAAKQYQTFCCFIRYEKQPQNPDNKAKDACPIIEISCIVSKDNVYFNLQDAIKLPAVDLNVDDEKLWKPFLSERIRNDLFQKGVIQSIQTPINDQFYPPYKKLQSRLESTLHEEIKTHLENERKNHFKPYTYRPEGRISSDINKRLLPLCEPFKSDHRIMGSESALYNERSRAVFDEAVAKIQEERDRVKNEIPPNKTLFGFTLNMTYTTSADIIEKITETQIHLDENNDLQFVLSVRCFEYPCHIFSVWVFVGTIGIVG